MAIPDETHHHESLEKAQGKFVIQEVATSCHSILLSFTLSHEDRDLISQYVSLGWNPVEVENLDISKFEVGIISS